MSELHKFMFDGVPARGALVRLTDAWQELLARRASNVTASAYPPPVVRMLGEMTAASVLLRAALKFDGKLVLQVSGDGPVRMAVVEVADGLALRATATFDAATVPDADLPALINAGGGGRCAITLDTGGQGDGQSYQGIVPLVDESGAAFPTVAALIEHYMRRSEQIGTVLVLAANPEQATGLLLQRMPGEHAAGVAADAPADFERLAVLTRTLQPDELQGLDADTVLRRLYWDEALRRLPAQAGADVPHFHCPCSRERVTAMLRGLGSKEVDSILREHGMIEVSCEFCGRQQRFDAVDMARLFSGQGRDWTVPELVQ